MDRSIDRQLDRQIDRQTDRQTYKNLLNLLSSELTLFNYEQVLIQRIEQMISRHKYGSQPFIIGQIDRRIDRQLDRIDKSIDRQIDRQINRQIDSKQDSFMALSILIHRKLGALSDLVNKKQGSTLETKCAVQTP